MVHVDAGIFEAVNILIHVCEAVRDLWLGSKSADDFLDLYRLPSGAGHLAAIWRGWICAGVTEVKGHPSSSGRKAAHAAARPIGKQLALDGFQYEGVMLQNRRNVFAALQKIDGTIE